MHPHPRSRFLSVTVAVVDLSRAAVRLQVGSKEPKPPKGVELDRPGLVPTVHLDSLIAIFNGGYQPHHGWWGILLNGVTYIKPRPDGCTVALTRTGSVQIAPWPAIETHLESVVAYRQTPPCLLEEGQLNARLATGNDRAWGGQNPDRVTRRRSAIGVNSEQQLFFYALGSEVGARYLAEGLRYAGATAAAQLDINWNWTRFLLVEQPAAGAPPEIVGTLVEDMAHGKHEYLERPTARDFFYIHLKTSPQGSP